MSTDYEKQLDSLISQISNLEDFEKMLNKLDIDNLAKDAQENASPEYKAGYDAGFVDGYQEAQTILNVEKQSIIYNEALNDVMDVIEKFDFDHKTDIVSILQTLQR